MKNIIIPLAFVAAVMFSCTRIKPVDKAEVGGLQSMPDVTGTEYYIYGTGNVVRWTGKEIAGSHHGTLRIKEGKITVNNMEISSGKFVFEMDSIKNSDLTDKRLNAKLVDDLKSANFFDVSKYPSAIFEIVSVLPLIPEFQEGEILTNFEVSGSLTIKDVTNIITFPARIDLDENTASVETNSFSINRTHFGITHRSGSFFNDLKDQLIYDEIILGFRLKFNRSDLTQNID